MIPLLIWIAWGLGFSLAIAIMAMGVLQATMRVPSYTAGEALIIGFGKAAGLLFSVIPLALCLVGFAAWRGWL